MHEPPNPVLYLLIVLMPQKASVYNFKFPLENPVYNGDIYEGIAMMGIGDSASFRISADSFFLITVRAPSLPPYILPGSKLTFDVKLIDIETEDDRIQEENQLREDAENKLAQYLIENNISVTPMASGLYYIEKEKGSGVRAKTGNTVHVHYTGKFLDGTIFDSSLDSGTPFSFKLGAGEVIKGWDEGIALMNKGGKATSPWVALNPLIKYFFKHALNLYGFCFCQHTELLFSGPF